ncbi:acyl-CoA thioesterase [Hamadaea flava]|nr:acyl-CoA thioesterase [Hamadaea flava]
MDEAHELARRSADAMYADDLASQRAGATIEGVEPGRAVARMSVTRDMINGHDICHGGYVFLLADTAFAFACNTYGTPTVAESCDIVFVRAARLGDELTAVATERTRYGRSGIYDVTVTCGDEVIAEFRGKSRELRKSPEG